MKDKKTSTFIYHGLGFPIKLINAPMTKEFGEWCIDINFNKLHSLVLDALLHKPGALNGGELRYIRKYLKMPRAQFGKLLGISKLAVLDWENELNGISPTLDLCIRLHVLNHLQVSDKEFRAVFNALSLPQLSKKPKKKTLTINALGDLKVI